MELEKFVENAGMALGAVALVGIPAFEIKYLKGNGAAGSIAGLAAYTIIFSGTQKIKNYIASNQENNIN